MNPKLRKLLIVSLKQAVNALLTNLTATAFWPIVFHLHSWAGVLNIVKLTGGIVWARELVVWGPVIFRWSQDFGNGNGGTNGQSQK